LPDFMMTFLITKHLEREAGCPRTSMPPTWSAIARNWQLPSPPMRVTCRLPANTGCMTVAGDRVTMLRKPSRQDRSRGKMR
jgi:hypothetical protein